MNAIRVRFLICLFLASIMIATYSSAANAPAIEVGHVYYLDGEVLRYVPQEQDWVAVVRDAPVTTEDALYSADTGRAEIIIPNGSLIRIGNITQLQFTGLSADLSEADIASGVARFYSRGARTVIKATSPFGYVLANPGTVFDFYVGENSVEVVAIKGTVSFIHLATNARYDVVAGSPSILADANQVSSGEGTVDADWDKWNAARDSFWAARLKARGRSAGYLPPNLEPEAYALDENGTWEMVPYQGRQCWFWRPTDVPSGWSPFTRGRWTDWYGDQTWIPDEPFGYVTHHYGNWVYARDRWYWAPPVAGFRVGLSFLNIAFFFSPGRVSWIHSERYVGWVPLAPDERYYSRRNWGDPHEVVVNNVNITRITINVRNYAYADHAVVVPQGDFYNVKDYRNVRVANVNRATINTYRAAPVVDNTVVPNYTTNRQRYQYANVPVKEKPHSTVIKRIQHNETTIRGARKANAAVVERQVKSVKQGKINREAKIGPPKTTDYLVPVNEVNRPKSEVKLQQKDLKRAGGTVRPAQPAQVVVPRYVAPAKPGGKKQVVVPEHVAPAQPEHPGQAVVPEHAIPAKPGQKSQVVVPEHATPVKPGQKERPGQVVVPQHTAPAKPGQPGQVVVPEHVLPARPTQPAPPGQVVVPQHVAPARPDQSKKVVVPQHVAPAQPEHPSHAVVPEHVAPAGRGQSGQVVVPEHATPAKPPQKERPGQVVVPQHTAPASPAQAQKVVVPQHVAPVKPSSPPPPAQPPRPPQAQQPPAPQPPPHAAPPKPAPPPPQVQPPAKPPTPPPPAQPPHPPQVQPPAKPQPPQPPKKPEGEGEPKK